MGGAVGCVRQHSWTTEVTAVLPEWMVLLTILHVKCICKLCPKVGWDNRLGSVIKEATGCSPLWLGEASSYIMDGHETVLHVWAGLLSRLLCQVELQVIQQGHWMGFLPVNATCCVQQGNDLGWALL